MKKQIPILYSIIGLSVAIELWLGATLCFSQSPAQAANDASPIHADVVRFAGLWQGTFSEKTAFNSQTFDSPLALEITAKRDREITVLIDWPTRRWGITRTSGTGIVTPECASWVELNYVQRANVALFGRYLGRIAKDGTLEGKCFDPDDLKEAGTFRLKRVDAQMLEAFHKTNREAVQRLLSASKRSDFLEPHWRKILSMTTAWLTNRLSFDFKMVDQDVIPDRADAVRVAVALERRENPFAKNPYAEIPLWLQGGTNASIKSCSLWLPTGFGVANRTYPLRIEVWGEGPRMATELTPPPFVMVRPTLEEGWGPAVFNALLSEIRAVLPIDERSVAVAFGRDAEPWPRPIYAESSPVCACESLTKIFIPNTTINSATVSNRLCLVTATVTHPPSRDAVKVFLALPMTAWNGRFRGEGGGGFRAGNAFRMTRSATLGYAAGTTDAGNEGGTGSLALDANRRLNWQGIVNFAYLGVHDMTLVGKALTQAFYGKPPRYSYFVGTSTGGRQGLMEAQRYPEDYDGIVSAAPALNIPQLTTGYLWPQLVMLEAKNFVSAAKLNAATAASIAACDEIDGVKDGVIDNPWRCAYDPKELVGTKIGESAFTEADATVIRKIWEGPRAQNGQSLWYGLARGASLLTLAGTDGSPLGGKPNGLTLDWFRYFLLQDPQWDWTTITSAEFERRWKQGVEQYGAVIGSDNPDLTGFRDRSGKLLIYHGLADQFIPAEMSIEYLKHVQQRMGGAEQTAGFVRFFVAPGVDHGFRGPGPSPTGEIDAIIRWVEEGKAPDLLVGERRDSHGRVVGTRPLFPYPHIAKYKGSGSPDDAANFVPDVIGR